MAAGQLRMTLVGPFKLEGPGEEVLTPRLGKSRALLAILALSRGYRKGRFALQDLLWSDRGHEQGSASLRQALADIRKSLGAYRECIFSTNGMVGLLENRIEIDIEHLERLRSPSHMGVVPFVLLEDFDSIQDPEFEDWLRDQRLAFEEVLAPMLPEERDPIVEDISAIKLVQQPGTARVTLSSAPKPWLCAPKSRISENAYGAFYERVLSTAIIQGISDMGDVQIVTELKEGPGLILDTEVLAMEKGATAIISLVNPSDDVTVWQSSRFIKSDGYSLCDDIPLMKFANQTVDIALHTLRCLVAQGENASAYATGYDAVCKMFTLDRAALLEADDLLDKAYSQSGNGLMLAWKAYLRTFLVAEHGYDYASVSDEVRQLAREALQKSPNNSYTLALTSYVHSFLLHEYATGADLANRSLDLSPTNPLGMAHLGFAKAYSGQSNAGLTMLSKAREMTGSSPYRYSIDFLCGVAATLNGSHQQAIALNEAVHGLKPEFKPALRYLAALYLYQGAEEDAHTIAQQLRRIEPDFSISMMLDPSYPSTGIRQAGLLQQYKTSL